jgi:hypothetical protein
MNLKFLLATAGILFPFCFAQAQDAPRAEAAERLFKINFLAPGFEYEQRIAASSTLNVNPFLGFAIDANSRTGFNYSLAPSLAIQARRYYNLGRRMEKGKNTANNSGNFVALFAGGSTAAIVTKDMPVSGPAYVIGPVWGLQRSYKSGFNLTLSLGAGRNNTRFTPITWMSMGFLVGRR